MRGCLALPLVLALGLSGLCWSPSSAQLMNSAWPVFRHDLAHTGRSALAGPASPTLGWSRQIGASTSSPAVGQNAIYTLSGGSLMAIGFGGEQLWSYPCGSGSRSSPAIDASGTIYVACDAWLYAINFDGTLKWRKALPGSSDASPTIGSDGTVYIGCSQGKFQAYTSSGAVRFTYTTGRAVTSSAAIASDGTIYFGCDDGCLYALKADGTLRWKFTTNPVGAIQASPALGADGSIYFGTSTGYFFAVSPTGTQKWRYGGGVSTSSPALGGDGTIYFGSQDKNVYALSKVGSLRWKFAARGAVNSSPAVDSNGIVYFGSDDGSIYALNPDGGKAWEYAAGSAVASSPAIGESRTLYVVASDGLLLRLSADTTPPLVPVVTDDGAYSTYQSALHASWVSADPESGIARYEYAIGTAPGLQDVLSFTDAGAAGEIVAAGLGLVGGQRYFFSVRAINGAGLASEVGLSDGVVVDFTPPATPSVADDGAYSTSSTALHASWASTDGETGVVRYEYAIGTASGADDVVAFTDAGLAKEVARTDLSLTNGSRYYFTVRATNAAGLVSAAGVSDGIMVDYTPPQTPIVMDDGRYTTSAGTLHFVFGSGDTESGIDHYEFSIGTALGQADTLAWRDAGTLREHTIDGLNLGQGGRYFVNVRSYNRAGLMSEGSSNGIVVDLTPPVLPVIQVSSATLTEIRFRVSAADAESGVEGLQYAVLMSPDASSAAWVDCQADTEIVLTGQFGGQGRYVAARARNGAGLWSDVATQMVTADPTPPTTPVVTDDGAYSTSSSTLGATWSSQDPETGIASYLYCVGTAAGNDDVVKWTSTAASGVVLTGLALANGGRYYFSVKSINNAGLTSAVGCSDGITIDTTAPAAPVVVDDGEFTSVVDSLHARFATPDAQSGIAEYCYCIGTSVGAADVVAWTSVGASTSATAYGLSLQPGKTYYFSAKARNGAGLWSAVGSSDGIAYCSQTPAWPKFHMDASNGGRSAVNACISGHLNWRVQTDGYIESSAAFAGDGTAYIGSADGKVYAIGSGGSVRWTYATGGAVDSSPAIGPNGEIYVGSCDRNLYCIGSSGKLQWKYATSGMIWSSPAVAGDGTVYFGGQDGYFYALKSDGTLRWKFNTGAAVWSSPAIAHDGTIYFACGNGKLYALNSLGGLKWSYQTGTAADSSPAIGSNGVVYFGSGDGVFYAINSDGTLKWRAVTGQLVDSTAAVGSDGTLYVGTGGAGYAGSMRAYSPTGAELWRMMLPAGVRSSPAIDGRGNIYFGTADGKFCALRPDGSQMWSYAAGLSVLSSPAIGPDGQVIVGADDGGIYCFKDYPNDVTPPTKPVVTPSQSFLPKGAALVCRWSSSDAESGIESYSYAIGTQPGLSDVANWAEVGAATSASRADLTLTVGQSYYVSVKARNHVGLTSEVGSSAAIVVVPENSNNRIGEARKRAEGTRVYLPGKVVTGVFADSVFIEEPDRTAGIRCSLASSDLHVGAVVDAFGKISVQNGEAVLVEVSLSRLAAAGEVKPVATSLASVAGPGLDMTGLLVRIAGRVTKSGAYYFVLSDGSVLNSPRGVKGIEVRAGAGDIPLLGAYAAISGVVSRDVVNGSTTPIVRAIPGSCLVVAQ